MFALKSELEALRRELKEQRQLREAFEIMTLARYHYAERGKWPDNVETLLMMNCYNDAARIDASEWRLHVACDVSADWMIIVESTDGIRRSWASTAYVPPTLTSRS